MTAPDGSTDSGEVGDDAGDDDASTDPTQDPEVRPVLGEVAVASAARGVVRFRPPGGVVADVEQTTVIPSGSVVDTRAGTLTLESAVDAAGKTQKAKFNGATFRMKLSTTDVGMVDVYLTHGPLACPSPDTVMGSAARAVPRPSRLWSKDRNGRYRTHGRNSVALVRGTQWTTTDSCDGTLTKVSDGIVAVTDNGTGETVQVKAGHQYLARRTP